MGVNSVAFSPDGKILASGSGDKTIKLWNVTSGKELHTLQGHADVVFSVAFSPNGKTLASGSFKAIKLWDVASGKELRTITLGYGERATEVIFSSDGKTLADVDMDGTYRLWDVASGTELHTH